MDLKSKAKKEVDNLIKLLNSEDYLTGEVEIKQYNFEVPVSKKKQTVKLLVYFGKKGIKKVVQGNKELPIFNEVQSLVQDKFLFEDNISEVVEPENYVGIDESGKGDYFGPLVIAGFYADKKNLSQLKNIGVKDSKTISDYGIKNLAYKIRQIGQNNFNIVVINPERYNELNTKFGNLNRLLAWGHSKVLENLLEKNIGIKEAISDKFGNEKYIKEALQNRGKDILLHQLTKAEKYSAVAAASILARDKFNDWFDIQKVKYNIKFPKGASGKVETEAKKFIDNFGENEIKKLVKVHFKTSKKIGLINR